MDRKSSLSNLLILPLVLLILLVLPACKKNDYPPVNPAVPDSITDIDGNVYHTVKIGTQAWLAENLETTHYRNGEPIPDITDSVQWEAASSGGYCNYENLEINAGLYGRLYNWNAVNDSRCLCPAGWHIPTEDEWSTLMDHLGGELTAGGELKDTGTVNWFPPNTGATNSSGFAALPAGYRNDHGIFGNRTISAIFWTSTAYDARHAWYRYLYYNYNGMYKDHYHDKSHGFSVRCILDN